MSGGPFGATRALEIVTRTWSSGLLWKKIKLTSTRKANAKKRLRRVWQNEAVMRACAEPPFSQVSSSNVSAVEGG